ncbi:MAG: hypothetical protein Q7T82_20600 [Armatimonadota bacterium]|nr:hypothetical protein [Armatimonadota bacterium]
MAMYPISVPRKLYSGGKASKKQEAADHNRLAGELQKHINAKVNEREEEEQTYLYYEIANEMGYDPETVRKILYGVDGGHHGLTVTKPKGAFPLSD